MRRLMSVSILALSLAMANSANAQDWFRLNMPPTIFFGTAGEGETPPDGGVNNNIDINIDAEVNGRVYGNMTIPVSVMGIDATYTVSVTNLPSGATWTADTQVYGSGSIQWPSATQGTYYPTIEVRDADGALVATSDLEIVVHASLAAAVSQPVYEVEVGGELSIVPEVDNLIGTGQWGSVPSPLPEWLNFDATTGRINVNTAAPNLLAEIVLTAVDQGDLGSASTLPFSISVNGADTDYWVTTLGGATAELGRTVVVAPDGGLYVGGQTNSTGAGGYDLLLTKFSASGELQWQRTLGGSGDDFGGWIASGPDGALYVAGYTRSAGVGIGNLLLAKYDQAGTLQWQRLLDGTNLEYAQSVTVGADGGIFVGGYTQSVGSGANDFLLAKYDAAGALQWQRILGGTSYEYAYGVTAASDGSIYITGYTSSSGAGSNDVLLAKYNASGALQWQRTLGGSSIDQAQAVEVGSDGSIYITGYNYNGPNPELLLAKYNTFGALQWQRTLGGTASDGGNSIAIGADGYIYVNGTTASTGAGGVDFLFAKYDTSGTLQWQRTLGGSGSDQGVGITAGSDGSIYLTGSGAVGGSVLLLARLPADSGPKMVAGDFIYQEANLTSGTPSLASSASSLTAAASSLTSSTLSLTGGTSALASTSTQFVEE